MSSASLPLKLTEVCSRSVWTLLTGPTDFHFTSNNNNNSATLCPTADDFKMLALLFSTQPSRGRLKEPFLGSLVSSHTFARGGCLAPQLHVYRAIRSSSLSELLPAGDFSIVSSGAETIVPRYLFACLHHQTCLRDDASLPSSFYTP